MDAFDRDLQEAVRAGVIQNFEIAYEQSWKMMKRWLEDSVGATYVDGVTRRELFRLAAEHRLITDVDALDGVSQRTQPNLPYLQ